MINLPDPTDVDSEGRWIERRAAQLTNRWLAAIVFGILAWLVGLALLAFNFHWAKYCAIALFVLGSFVYSLSELRWRPFSTLDEVAREHATREAMRRQRRSDDDSGRGVRA